MPEIGFVGLGIMGKPMVRNLLKAGYKVTVFNRTPGAAQELVQEGAQSAASPAAVAAASDIIFTMVTASSDVSEVICGKNGILESLRAGHIIIDMSTISPITARELARQVEEHGGTMLDAPVSGGDKGAIEGTLSIMVGGDAAAFEKSLPVLSVLGKTIVRVGESGAGQTVKACNQLVVALNYLALSEALVLGSKAGVDPTKILEVLGGGLANSRVLELRGARMANHDFVPGGRVALHHKDLGIIHDLARSLGAVLPATALVEQLYASLMQAGHSQLDHSSVLLAIEQLSNHTI